ncbi:MAG: YraN family protein [Acidobacteria bacterium]|nr:YraN family protein [Acidobacteriota bacterium]MBI3261629.1 YraN family protein [Acidobacteriota bacterium]
MGEILACRELQRLGYAILARRYRTRFGEIDVIARDGETIAFVEVKMRATEAFGEPAAAVTPRKQRRLGLAAMDYLGRWGLEDTPCRFDVVSISVCARGEPRVELFRAAFDADFAQK